MAMLFIRNFTSGKYLKQWSLSLLKIMKVAVTDISIKNNESVSYCLVSLVKIIKVAVSSNALF